MTCERLRRAEICAQSEEVNCDPRSVVMVCVTPKREIHAETSASAHEEAVVEDRGTASGQRVVLSTMVRRCVLPCEEGSGPTMSRWT